MFFWPMLAGYAKAVGFVPGAVPPTCLRLFVVVVVVAFVCARLHVCTLCARGLCLAWPLLAGYADAVGFVPWAFPPTCLRFFLLCSYVVRRTTPRVPRYRERRNPRGRHFVTRVLRDRLPVCGVFAKVDLRSCTPFLRRSRSGENDFGLARPS